MAAETLLRACGIAFACRLDSARVLFGTKLGDGFPCPRGTGQLVPLRDPE